MNGDNAQFEQEHRLPGDTAYGGIQDLHFEGPLGKDGLFSVDGHALLDTNDYDIHCNCRSQSSVISKPVLLNFGVGTTGTAGSFRTMAARFFRRRFPKCTSIEGTRGLNWACVCQIGPK